MIKPKDGRFWTGLIKKYLTSIMPLRNVCRTPESGEVGEAETVFSTQIKISWRLLRRRPSTVCPVTAMDKTLPSHA